MFYLIHGNNRKVTKTENIITMGVPGKLNTVSMKKKIFNTEKLV